MGVHHLNPSNVPQPQRDTSRSRQRASPLATPAATPLAGGTSRTRLTPTTAARGDRLERTPELEQKLAGLKQELDRAPEAHPVDLDAIREELASSRQASRETLLRAATGILQGELFFTQQA